jgi:sec-independent protein translocase protein TatA
MLRNLTAWHLLIVVVVLVLIFGANKLPELAKGVGSSLKILKNEMKDLSDGNGDGTGASVAAAAPSTAERVAPERAAAPE